MSREPEIDPALPREQREELAATAKRLARERPVPSASFHGRLRHTLLRAFRKAR